VRDFPFPIEALILPNQPSIPFKGNSLSTDTVSGVVFSPLVAVIG